MKIRKNMLSSYIASVLFWFLTAHYVLYLLAVSHFFLLILLMFHRVISGKQYWNDTKIVIPQTGIFLCGTFLIKPLVYCFVSQCFSLLIKWPLMILCEWLWNVTAAKLTFCLLGLTVSYPSAHHQRCQTMEPYISGKTQIKFEFKILSYFL